MTANQKHHHHFFLKLSAVLFSLIFITQFLPVQFANAIYQNDGLYLQIQINQNGSGCSLGKSFTQANTGGGIRFMSLLSVANFPTNTTITSDYFQVLYNDTNNKKFGIYLEGNAGSGLRHIGVETNGGKTYLATINWADGLTHNYTVFKKDNNPTGTLELWVDNVLAGSNFYTQFNPNTAHNFSMGTVHVNNAGVIWNEDYHVIAMGSGNIPSTYTIRNEENWASNSTLLNYTINCPLPNRVNAGVNTASQFINRTTSIDLIAIDSSNNIRYNYTNGETLILSALLQSSDGTRLTSQLVSFQKLVNAEWGNPLQAITASDFAVAEIPILNSGYIGQTATYRVIFSGITGFSSSASNNITITTVSVNEIPNRHTITITGFGITKDFRELTTEISRNEKFYITANFLIDNQDIFSQDENLLRLFRGSTINFYMQKNNTGNYFLIDTQEVSGQFFADVVSRGFILGNTFTGQQNIRIVYDGSYTFTNTSATTSFTVYSNASMIINLNADQTTIRQYQIVKLTGSVGLNNSIGLVSPTDVNLLFWIRNSTSQFFPFLKFGGITQYSIDVYSGNFELNVQLPTEELVYTIKANGTRDYISGQSNNITIRVGSTQPPRNLQPAPPSPDMQQIFDIPMDNCSSGNLALKEICGFVFWIIMEIVGEFIVVGFFLVMSGGSKDISINILGVIVIMTFLSIFAFAYAVKWLPFWSPIIIIVPTAFMFWQELRHRGTGQ